MNKRSVVLELDQDAKGEWVIWIDDDGQRRQHPRTKKTEAEGLSEMDWIEISFYHHGAYNVTKRYARLRRGRNVPHRR